jgi:environmental stress-induced protein Ves
MRIVRQSSYAAVPWKNGGGITREAIRIPAEGDAFRWRVSIAQIDASGPFSDFAAYRRFMVLLKGAGVLLKFTDRAAAAESSAPRARELRRVGDLEEFDGGLATHCDLVNGPCVDLNLMVSKELTDVRAWVESLAEPRAASLESGRALLVFPIDAAVEVKCAAAVDVLDPWDLALVPGGGTPTRIAPGRHSGSSGGARIFFAELPTTSPSAAPEILKD